MPRPAALSRRGLLALAVAALTLRPPRARARAEARPAGLRWRDGWLLLDGDR
jgi:hypothetical protein